MNIFERDYLERKLLFLRDMSAFFYGSLPRELHKEMADCEARLGKPWWDNYSRAMGWLK